MSKKRNGKQWRAESDDLEYWHDSFTGACLGEAEKLIADRSEDIDATSEFVLLMRRYIRHYKTET
jgi:hypothetical protein